MKTKILTGILAVSAMFFMACGDDDDGTKADLKWKNSSSASVSSIKWKSGSSTDQTWDETVADTKESQYKGITKLSGSGECLDDQGDTATIAFDSNASNENVSIDTINTATVTEDSTAAIVISQVSKKK